MDAMVTVDATAGDTGLRGSGEQGAIRPNLTQHIVKVKGKLERGKCPVRSRRNW